MKNVVITGLGVVSGFGFGKDNYWNGLINGNVAIKELTLFDNSEYKTRLAAQAPIELEKKSIF